MNPGSCLPICHRHVIILCLFSVVAVGIGLGEKTSGKANKVSTYGCHQSTLLEDNLHFFASSRNDLMVTFCLRIAWSSQYGTRFFTVHLAFAASLVTFHQSHGPCFTSCDCSNLQQAFRGDINKRIHISEHTTSQISICPNSTVVVLSCRASKTLIALSLLYCATARVALAMILVRTKK